MVLGRVFCACLYITSGSELDSLTELSTMLLRELASAIEVMISETMVSSNFSALILTFGDYRNMAIQPKIKLRKQHKSLIALDRLGV